MHSSKVTGSIEEVAKALLLGELAAIPTETVYGLAADATNQRAVAKVFELKGRPADHPLIVHCGGVDQAWQCADFVSEPARVLAAAFWPGPLTLVLPKSDIINPAITGGQTSVAVRVPGHPTTQRLLAAVAKPLVAPSANRFGKVSPTCAEHVLEEFPNDQLLILDGGACEVGIESTIVDCRVEEKIAILRPGKIHEFDLEKVLGSGVSLQSLQSRPEVKVSGNLPSHYAPQATVVLVESGQIYESFLLDELRQGTHLIIASAKKPERVPSNVSWQQVPGDLDEFARQMYSLFRRADQLGIDQIVVELPKAEGIGIALRDRLIRAAT